MADVLVDTTIWIDFFRKSEGPEGDLLDELLDQNRALLCGVTEMEVYQGLKAEEREKVESAFRLLPYLDTTRADFVAAGTLWNRLRRRGITLPATDCLIAALCRSRGLRLFTSDRHFDAFAPAGLKRLRPPS